MSGTFPAHEPEWLDGPSDSVEVLINARPRDLGGFAVRRVLPSARRRLIGPFIFFDHMGPAELAVGKGIDVRPHPHIGLATVTYLFEGELDHRDSLGTLRTIRPGDVNWMVAGRGIVHSERSGPESRKLGVHMHGIQCWLALPLEEEQTEPRFEHHPTATIPKLTLDGAELEVVAGAAYGVESPVGILSPTLYVHARLDAGASLPIDDAYEERAIYVIEGEIGCERRKFGPGAMLVLRPAAKLTITAGQRTRVMLVGGAKLAGERHIYWNFVSSSAERLEQAKQNWANGRFSKVPGDEVEFIPLPDT
jgi:redox-sensitive bicupin YhaK (pirin superfamily)